MTGLTNGKHPCIGFDGPDPPDLFSQAKIMPPFTQQYGFGIQILQRQHQPHHQQSEQTSSSESFKIILFQPN
ncbi:hypothetical protein IQ266_01515 [filamentous cyanobacterium LEGE 11480]|uniref:Uncharacterized protein n=1 Tax=Romeriopsis navalis LEGE 11480 TaxID=2777977 RepID=A0A928VL90_9CYAN|nr:hypothetical protein [Romeriopsis navalis]MBE9028432.1 hypothetical protein [Romeriopsis navalis LEGE 11480]